MTVWLVTAMHNPPFFHHKLNHMARFFTLTLLSLLTIGIVQAQTWDGGAGTTNWDDGDNWDPNGVPSAGATVIFGTSVTVTNSGAASPPAPARVQVNSNHTVILDLNLNITGSEHAVKVQSNATLIFGVSGNNREFNITPATNKYGFQHNANGSNPAVIEIAPSTTVNIDLADDGIRIEGTANNSIFNQGTLTIEDSSSDGIDIVTGSFTNAGTLTITDANTNGIYVKSGGTFTNSGGSVTIENPGTTTNNGVRNDGTFGNDSGTLTIDNANTDGIEANAGMTNGGTIEVTSSANNTNNGIYIASTFSNTGMINISGVDNYGIHVDGGSLTNDGTVESSSSGSGSARHGLYVEDGSCTNNNTFTASVTNSNARAARTGPTGTITNNAQFTASGGNTGQRIRIEGTLENSNGAKLDLSDGRISMQDGATTFTNNGLVMTSSGGAPVYFGGSGAPLEVAVNNAFFKAGGSNFTSGSAGSATDNGFEATATETISAGGACSATIANASYEWSASGEAFTGTSSGVGVLAFPLMSVENDNVTLEATIFGETITVQVEDICAAAVILPVEWLGIQAIPQSKSVLLKWQTATETNNDFMAIEHSSDGSSFQEIGRVQGVGNSTTSQSYQWEDFKPVVGTNYYRLRQVDFDGTTDYSPIVSAEFKQGQDEDVFEIYPTVLQRGQAVNVQLNTAPSTDFELAIYDGNGRLVLQQSVQDQVFELDLSSLISGSYWMSVRYQDSVQSERFVITR